MSFVILQLVTQQHSRDSRWSVMLIRGTVINLFFCHKIKCVFSISDVIQLVQGILSMVNKQVKVTSTLVEQRVMLLMATL